MLTAINVKGLKTYGYHGLFEEERTLGQKFVFDVTARLQDIGTHGEDHLQASVRYDAVVEEVVGIAGTRQFQTLEALGEAIATGLMVRFDPIESVVVGISKLSPPIPHAIDQVGVEICLKRREMKRQQSYAAHLEAQNSEEGLEIRYARSEDVAEIIVVLHEAADWMRFKDTPAWDKSVLNQAFVEKSIASREMLVAVRNGMVVGVCTLSAFDPEFWPDAPEGYAAYLHKLAVLRSHASRNVSSSLIAECQKIARQWKCSKLRLDCHPNLRGLYERLGFTHVDTFRRDAVFVIERLEMAL